MGRRAESPCRRVAPMAALWQSPGHKEAADFLGLCPKEITLQKAPPATGPHRARPLGVWGSASELERV